MTAEFIIYALHKIVKKSAKLFESDNSFGRSTYFSKNYSIFRYINLYYTCDYI